MFFFLEPFWYYMKMSPMKRFGMMKNSPQATVNTLTMKGCATMPLLRQNKEYTIDDIYALPDGQRAELIDGQMYMMAPPTRRHQQILGALYRKVAEKKRLL